MKYILYYLSLTFTYRLMKKKIHFFLLFWLSNDHHSSSISTTLSFVCLSPIFLCDLYLLYLQSQFFIINISFSIIIIILSIFMFIIELPSPNHFPTSKSVIAATYIISVSEIYRSRRLYGRDILIFPVSSRFYYDI